MPVRFLPLLTWRRRARWTVLLASGWLTFASGGIAAPAPAPAPSAAPASAAPQPLPSQPAAPRSAEEFAQVLQTGNLDALLQTCLEAQVFGDTQRLRQLHRRLLSLHPAPQPLAVVLANADVLLRCQAPQAAQEVLDRFGPAPGAERQQWLLLQWRIAAAALDHRRAVIALGRLVQLEGADLEGLALPVRLNDDGTVATRSALDVLIDHWVSLGRPAEAVRLSSRSRASGALAARRLQQAATLPSDLDRAARNALLETALEQAAAVGAWGLVAELLDQQLLVQRGEGGDPAQAIERRLRLSPAMDDAYGEWVLRRQLAPSASGANAARLEALERELRSPRAPGGHADPALPPARLQP